MGKRVVNARSDSSGRTTSVLLSGNSTYTSIDRAIGMAEKGQIEGAHAVRPRNIDPYLRTNPDGRTRNNIDTLSGDK